MLPRPLSLSGSVARFLSLSRSSSSSSSSSSFSSSSFSVGHSLTLLFKSSSCSCSHQPHRSFATTPKIASKPISPLINKPPSEVPPAEQTKRWSQHIYPTPTLTPELRTFPINHNASPDRTSSVIQLPILALGTRTLQNQLAFDAVKQAIEHGIFHIDTATGFRNFSTIARALRNCGLPRSSFFLSLKWSAADIPTNHWTAVQRMSNYIKSSGLGYVDVLSIHWPGNQTALSTSRPANYRHRYMTWRVMEDIYNAGLTKALGVSNFEPGHIGEILEYCSIPPAINQIEYHPFLTHVQQHNIDFAKQHGILTTGFASLATGWPSLQTDNTIRRIVWNHNRALTNRAEKAGQESPTEVRTATQVILRWSLQHGVPPTIRVASPSHIAEVSSIYNFSLSEKEMRDIDRISYERGMARQGKRFFGDPRLVA